MSACERLPYSQLARWAAADRAMDASERQISLRDSGNACLPRDSGNACPSSMLVCSLVSRYPIQQRVATSTDRVGDLLAASEVRRVPAPALVALPWNLGILRKCRGIAGLARAGLPSSWTFCLSATRRTVDGQTNTAPTYEPRCASLRCDRPTQPSNGGRGEI
jgi:hypothetical protein